MERGPLTRPRDGRLLGGVCAGLARHLDLPVSAVRAAVLIAGLLGGAGALFYGWLLVTVPAEGESDPVLPMRRVFTGGAADSEGPTPTGHSGLERDPTPWRRFPVAELVLGASFLVAGGALVAVQLGWHLRLEVILPGLAVLVGLGLTWWQVIDRDRPEKRQLPRLLGALALVAVGVLMFFVTARQPSTLTVIGAALAVLAGVTFAVAPWLLRINRELSAERAARAREAERAEIAAHLHDSVLQTLALIQQRSGTGSDVARLARAQERELREWLFRSADGAAAEPRDTVDAELRRHAAALEHEYAVQFEVVSVGERAVAPEAIVAASREAMLNAARHAGGTVTVYIETGQERIRVDVSDRGPGFDLKRAPDTRMGVRESILGRMERAGGTARITPGPGRTGVSVRLEQPRDVSASEKETR